MAHVSLTSLGIPGGGSACESFSILGRHFSPRGCHTSVWGQGIGNIFEARGMNITSIISLSLSLISKSKLLSQRQNRTRGRGFQAKSTQRHTLRVSAAPDRPTVPPPYFDTMTPFTRQACMCRRVEERYAPASVILLRTQNLLMAIRIVAHHVTIFSTLCHQPRPKGPHHPYLLLLDAAPVPTHPPSQGSRHSCRSRPREPCTLRRRGQALTTARRRRLRATRG